MKQRWVIPVFLIVSSTLAALTAAETALRFTRFRYLLSAYDPLPFHYKADPEAGHDIDERGPRLIHQVQQDGYSYEVWSNELGCFDVPYRGEREYILLVGDSFTEYLAPFGDMWGTRVERLLGIRVLKCGVGGYGTRQELIKAKRIVRRVGVRPRLIVLGYYVNDLDDDYRFPATTVVSGHLLTRQTFDLETGQLHRETTEHLERMVDRWERYCETPGVPAERFASLRCFLRRHSIVFDAARSFRRAPVLAAAAPPPAAYPLAFQSPDRYPWLRDAWRAHLNNLKELRALAETAGSDLFVVLIPSREQVEPDFPNAAGVDLERPNRTLHAFLDRERIKYLDLLPAFREAAPTSRLYWRQNAHFTVAGNRLASKLVARDLQRLGFAHAQ